MCIRDSYKIVEGKSRYEFFLPTYVGVDQLTGNSLYTLNMEDYFITPVSYTHLDVYKRQS